MIVKTVISFCTAFLSLTRFTLDHDHFILDQTQNPRSRKIIPYTFHVICRQMFGVCVCVCDHMFLHNSSTKPQEFEIRLENRSKVKMQPLGHSKQAEFIKLMDQQVIRKWSNVLLFCYLVCIDLIAFCCYFSRWTNKTKLEQEVLPRTRYQRNLSCLFTEVNSTQSC